MNLAEKAETDGRLIFLMFGSTVKEWTSQDKDLLFWLPDSLGHKVLDNTPVAHNIKKAMIIRKSVAINRKKKQQKKPNTQQF